MFPQAFKERLRMPIFKEGCKGNGLDHFDPLLILLTPLFSLLGSLEAGVRGDHDFGVGIAERDPSAHRIADEDSVFGDREWIVEGGTRDARQPADHCFPIFLGA